MYFKSQINVLFSSHFPKGLHRARAVSVKTPKFTQRAKGCATILEKEQERQREGKRMKGRKGKKESKRKREKGNEGEGSEEDREKEKERE